MWSRRSLPASCLALLALLVTSSCGLGPRVLVVVSLQTDLISRFEFTQVRTMVGDEVEVFAVGNLSFVEPGRVAELRASPGTVRVLVQLLDAADQLVAERLILVEVRRDIGVVAFISSSCRGVICPGANDTCIRGMCRGATSICGGEPCRPGGEACEGSECDARFCPFGICDADCTTDADCTIEDSCSDISCESSVCVGVPREGACPPGLFCAVGLGCTDVPPDVDHDGGVARDGSVSADAGVGGDGGVGPDLCVPCTTNCDTLGFGVCVDGFPTGECIPPDEVCNGMDEDCDLMIDEGLDCGHNHDITCQLGERMLPDGSFEPNRVDRIAGGGPGLVCANSVCTPMVSNCSTLPGGSDGHRHPVRFGGATTLTILDDVPFAVSATVERVADHTHGARCGIGIGEREIEGGFVFHRIAPMGLDEEPFAVGRYNQFCVPPVGDPTTECRPSFLYCQTR